MDMRIQHNTPQPYSTLLYPTLWYSDKNFLSGGLQT